MQEVKEVAVNVKCDVDEAMQRIKELTEAVKTAKTLAGELAEMLENLKFDIKV